MPASSDAPTTHAAPEPDRPVAIAWLAATFTIITWGSAFTGIAIALQDFGPGALALGRFAVASIALMLIAAARPVRRPSRAQLPRLIAVSLVGISAYHLLLNYGQRVVDPGVASLLIQVSPIITALLAARFDNEPVQSRQWFGIVLAAVGTVAIVLSGGRDLEFSKGAFMILGCALTSSVYFVFGRPLTRSLGARALTSWSMWIGSISFLIFLPDLMAQAHAASPAALASVLYIGVVPAALGYATWNYAVGVLGSARVSVLLYLSPIVAMGTHFAWSGALPSVTACLGGGLAIVGTFIATRAKRR